MLFHSEAGWVFETSPHTGEPKTAHVFPVRDTDRMLCRFDGTVEGILSGSMAWPRYKFQVGSEYDVQEKHGGEKLGKIVITEIAPLDILAHRGHDHARKCGYALHDDLVLCWAYWHDTDFYEDELLCKVDVFYTDLDAWEALRRRPRELYQAWLVSFKVAEKSG